MNRLLVRSLPETGRHDADRVSFAFSDAATHHAVVTDPFPDRQSPFRASAVFDLRPAQRRIGHFPRSGDENRGLNAQVSCAVPFNLFFPHS